MTAAAAKTHQAGNQSGFAGTVLSDNGKGFPTGNIQIYPGESFSAVRIGKSVVLQLDQWTTLASKVVFIMRDFHRGRLLLT